RDVVPALRSGGAAPAANLLLAPKGAVRLPLGERRRRGLGKRPRLPPLFRSCLPRSARPELTSRHLPPAGRFWPRHAVVPAPQLSDVLRDRPRRPDHLAGRRRATERPATARASPSRAWVERFPG